jgi:hypothetical protein
MKRIIVMGAALVLALSPQPAFGQSVAGAVRTADMPFAPGGASVDGYEQASMEVQYRFLWCNLDSSIYVGYNPQGASIRAGGAYWYRGERVAVPGGIAAPRLTGSVGLDGVALRNGVQVGRFGDGHATVNSGGQSCGSGNAKRIGPLPEGMGRSEADIRGYLNSLVATFTTPRPLQNGAIASAIVARQREEQQQAQRAEQERQAEARRQQQAQAQAQQNRQSTPSGGSATPTGPAAAGGQGGDSNFVRSTDGGYFRRAGSGWVEISRQDYEAGRAQEAAARQQAPPQQAQAQAQAAAQRQAENRRAQAEADRAREELLVGAATAVAGLFGQIAADREEERQRIAHRERVENERRSRIQRARQDLVSRYRDTDIPLSRERVSEDVLYFFSYVIEGARSNDSSPTITVTNVFPLARLPDGSWPLKPIINGEIRRASPGENVLVGRYASAEQAERERQTLIQLARAGQMRVQEAAYAGRPRRGGNAGGADPWGGAGGGNSPDPWSRPAGGQQTPGTGARQPAPAARTPDPWAAPPARNSGNQRESGPVPTGLPASASGAELFSHAADRLTARDYAGAAAAFAVAYERLEGQAQRRTSFFWGYSLYMSGREIAMANSDMAAGPAREALRRFQAALPLLEQGEHENAASAVSATRQFIANQEAILRAAQRP